MGISSSVCFIITVEEGAKQDLLFSYNAAKKIKEKQDGYCRRALAHDWHDLGEFPELLKWESLVDVLRGRVKVCSNCSS